jgi:signal transduction histidine kinase
MSQNPPTPEQCLSLATHYRRLGLRSAARSLLERIEKCPTNGAEARVELALLFLDDGDLERCSGYLHSTAPQDLGPKRLVLAGDMALAAGDFDRARHYFQAGLERPDCGQECGAAAEAGLLALSAAADDASALISLLREGLRWPLCSSGVAVVSRHATGTTAEALVAELEQGLAETVGLPVADFLQAEVLRNNGGDPQRVEELLRKAAPLAAARWTLALELCRRRRRSDEVRAQVIELLCQLLDEDLANSGLSPARIHLLLASVYDDRPEDGELAAVQYREALRYLPRDASAFNNLGVLALGRGEVGQAGRHFVQALAHGPTHDVSYLNLARLIHSVGSPIQIRPVAEVFAGRGAEPEAWANLCFALTEVGREEAHYGLADKAHQLKNLLGVVGSRLRRLLRDTEGENAEALQLVCEQLASLYEQWATFLRTMRDRPEELVAVDVNQIVRTASEMMNPPARLQLARSLPEIFGVASQLTEAVVNLLRNGWEAHRALGHEEPLRMSTRLLENRWIEIQVSDSGGGIDAADLRRVFVPGFTTKDGGSGFGLAITERLVHNHHGLLEVGASPSGGTCVKIVLPVQVESRLLGGFFSDPASRLIQGAVAEEYVSEDEGA